MRHNRWLLAIWLLLLVLCESVAQAASYYVDFTNGNEANPGTIGSPLKYHRWMSDATSGVVLSLVIPST